MSPTRFGKEEKRKSQNRTVISLIRTKTFSFKFRNVVQCEKVNSKVNKGINIVVLTRNTKQITITVQITIIITQADINTVTCISHAEGIFEGFLKQNCICQVSAITDKW